jgi:hypothetical protein
MIMKDSLIPKTQIKVYSFAFSIDTSFGIVFLRIQFKKNGCCFGIPKTCVFDTAKLVRGQHNNTIIC